MSGSNNAARRATIAAAGSRSSRKDASGHRRSRGGLAELRVADPRRAKDRRSRIVSREMVVFEWLGEANTPLFKAVSKEFLK
jgi:hypothetical protein